MKGFLVLESGEVFSGHMENVHERAGEVVFNTSHSGYEEIATDPSYHMQIMVMTAPMMGNYGVSAKFWESSKIHIQGFVSLESQNSQRDQSWQKLLAAHKIPQMSNVDTREIVLRLREGGTKWGALVHADTDSAAKKKAKELIDSSKTTDLDWAHQVCVSSPQVVMGDAQNELRAAVIDFGCKSSIINNLKTRFKEIHIHPSRSKAQSILKNNPSAIFLTNGPGDPEEVKEAVETVRELLGQRPIFGICMGHQILALALGGKTYKLKFGHRGSNHPIKDALLNVTYVTSQNHGYAVDAKSLPSEVQVTHTNLNDNTVAGIYYKAKKALSVQFHPESHPGPNESNALFDYFMKLLL